MGESKQATEPAIVEALVRAHEAALQATLRKYRMGAFAPPFGGGPKYWHLFPKGELLALCEGLAVPRIEELTRVNLYEIDCVACLDAFTARTKP